MKKSFKLVILLLSTLYILPTQAKLNWESTQSWRSQYPYITFVNKTNYDLLLAVTTQSEPDAEWHPIGKNQPISLVFSHNFKDLLATFAVVDNYATPNKSSIYSFTQNIRPDLAEINDLVRHNPFTAVKVTVVITETKNSNSRPLVGNNQKPNLNILINKEIIQAHTVASHTMAQKISSI